MATEMKNSTTGTVPQGGLSDVHDTELTEAEVFTQNDTATETDSTATSLTPSQDEEEHHPQPALVVQLLPTASTLTIENVTLLDQNADDLLQQALAEPAYEGQNQYEICTELFRAVLESLDIELPETILRAAASNYYDETPLFLPFDRLMTGQHQAPMERDQGGGIYMYATELDEEDLIVRPAFPSA